MKILIMVKKIVKNLVMKANNVGDGATLSLFVQEVWLDEHEDFNHDSQRT